MNDPSLPFVGFYWSYRVGLLLVSLSFMILVLELVRREHLKERYALLWLAAAACGLGVGFFPSLITWTSALFGFQYLTVFFVGSFLFLLMARIGQPSDVAGAVLLLCGPGGGYITGEIIEVNGGLMMM